MNDRKGDVSRLYPDLEALRKTEMLAEEIQTTGAVVMGRRAYDMAEGDLTDYEFQVPIFVLTHSVPEKVAKGENDTLTLTFVTDGIERAIEQAKAAAGDKHVMVIGGANTGSQHFYPSKSPLSKRRISIIETYLREKDAFIRYLLALQRRGVTTFYRPFRSWQHISLV